ncbi:MAG: hypothetical protein IKO61_02780 [Lachnospiraceae bacterium]|nr:hypothetical protein [Lachnospiraceae bacterium]
MENRNIFSEQTITELNKSLKEERQIIDEMDALCSGLMKLDAESSFSVEELKEEMNKFEGYLREQGVLGAGP